jgi:hypothetical protein
VAEGEILPDSWSLNAGVASHFRLTFTSNSFEAKSKIGLSRGGDGSFSFPLEPASKSDRSETRRRRPICDRARDFEFDGPS